MKTDIFIPALTAIAFSAALLSGCDNRPEVADQEPSEQAGEAVEQAVEETREAADTAVEKTREAASDVAEQTRETVEEAGDRIESATD
jgi:hypothetical protein